MADQDTPYPLEFVVAATPLSLQASSRSKERWKGIVREAARRRVLETDGLGFLDRRPLRVPTKISASLFSPLSFAKCTSFEALISAGALSLTISYFPAAPMAGDVDNIVKPIMDALVHVVYMDDHDVERVVVQKFQPQVDWEFGDPGDQLASALDLPPPVVYVCVSDDLIWRRL